MSGAGSRRLRVLYVCYLSLDDPLTHTQVVAYLRGLAAAGHTLHLLTFETHRLSRSELLERRWQLARAGIRWHHLRYHKRPSLPATAYDTLLGALYAWWLSLRFRLDVLHARAHVPAAMAMLTRRLPTRRSPSLIFDIRGLMAEEYVDAGRWVPDGLPFRLIKHVERRAVASAAGIVVLTHRVRAQLFGEAEDPRVFVIPCCADLDQFGAARGDRSEPPGEQPTMIYVGKLEGWYMAAEMVDFFAVARRRIPGLRFLILTQGPHAPISERIEQLQLSDVATIASAPADQVAAQMATATFGISFIRPAPSKASSSPTKVGEYLAAGLPVVATAGVGDLDTLLGPSVGVLVDQHTDAAYDEAAQAIAELLSDPSVPGRCHDLAQAELSLDAVGVPRYLALYEHVSQQLTSRAGAGTAPA